MTIRFRDEPRAWKLGDEFWTRRLTTQGSCGGSFLANVEEDDDEILIIEYLLQPLVDLPVCQKVKIVPLAEIECRSSFGCNHDCDLLKTYDEGYMWCLFRAFASWLEGPRRDFFHESWRNERWSYLTDKPLGGTHRRISF